MRSRRGQLIALILGWMHVALANEASAAVPPDGKLGLGPHFCGVCHQEIVPPAKVYLYEGKTTVCTPCHHSERARCWICRLPISDDYLSTPDGRHICDREFKEVVMQEAEAKQIFFAVQYQLANLTNDYLTVKQTPIEVSLFHDQPEVDLPRTGSDKFHRMGLSRTSRKGSEMHHQVWLRSGLTRSRMFAVAAHELTHLWLNENEKRGRKMDADSVEAVCELVAYKMLSLRGMSQGMIEIEQNQYTNGMIHRFIQLEKHLGVIQILEWAIRGDSERIDSQFSGRAEMTKRRRVDQRNPVLKLQSLVVDGQPRAALISNQIFQEGQTRTLRLGNSNVKITCVKIGSNSVAVLVNGGQRPVVLKLEKR